MKKMTLSRSPIALVERLKAGWKLSLFEKVILVNTLVLVSEALVGLWITSHSLEAHHYFIDTSFIVISTLLSLLINIILLRSSFRPLYSLLRTIRAVGNGQTSSRATDIPTDSEIGELALAFNEMLNQLETVRREHALLIFQAQEEERRRLARELHDESSQNLTALLVHTEILRQTLESLPDSISLQNIRTHLDTGFQQLTTLTESTLENVRTLALQLRPGVLDDLGLNAALRWLAQDYQQRFQLAVELQTTDLEEVLQRYQLPSVYATTIFRIMQECLTNVARHAQARHIWIHCSHGKESISLCIEDDGCGYDLNQRSPGLGIVGMRERVALLDGELLISSQPGQGTKIEVILPLSAQGNKELAHVK